MNKPLDKIKAKLEAMIEIDTRWECMVIENKELKICGRGIGGIWETRRKYKIPDFETVSQWEARKGCKYPDTAPLYALDEKVAPTVKPFYFLTDLRTVDKDRRVLIVATESGKPPDDWRPE